MEWLVMEWGAVVVTLVVAIPWAAHYVTTGRLKPWD